MHDFTLLCTHTCTGLSVKVNHMLIRLINKTGHTKPLQGNRLINKSLHPFSPLNSEMIVLNGNCSSCSPRHFQLDN